VICFKNLPERSQERSETYWYENVNVPHAHGRDVAKDEYSKFSFLALVLILQVKLTP